VKCSAVVAIGVDRRGVGRDNSVRRGLERFTRGTRVWYAGARAGVEAGAALEPAEEFRGVQDKPVGAEGVN
jgi:hypothetical protein